MKILVTGANSYLGGRLYQDLKEDFETYGTYNRERLFPELVKLDMADSKGIFSVIKQINPEVIVHAAAVPTSKLCEDNPKMAFEINVKGTEKILDAGRESGAKMIFISTGGAAQPYDVYTETKAKAEVAVKTHEDYVILRPAFVLGSSPNRESDRQQNRLLKNILQGIPASYDNTTKMQATWIGHISEVIKMCIEKGISGETIPIVADEKHTRFEISREILGHFEIECTPINGELRTIPLETTETLKRLRLPVYNYNEVIDKVVAEIQEVIGKS